MICTNCGKEIQDGASFCPYCGALFADGLVRIHYEAQLESSAETLPVYNAETVRAAWDRQKATIGDDLSAKLDQMTETPSADEGALGTDDAAADPRVTQDGEQATSMQMAQPQHSLQALHRRLMKAISARMTLRQILA